MSKAEAESKAEVELLQAHIEQLESKNNQLRAVITRAKDALLDGQSTQRVHDMLVDVLVSRYT
jgi:hypothetical protein